MRKPGRNEPCPCGSGKKYKKCCFGKEEDRGTNAISDFPKTISYRIREDRGADSRYNEWEFTIHNEDGKYNDHEINISWEEDSIVVIDNDGTSIPVQDFASRRRKPRHSGKDDKILSQVSSTVATKSIEKSITEFDALYAIDSNTKLVNGKYIMICIIAKVVIEELSQTSVNMKPVFVHALEAENTCHYTHTEPFMWRYGIEHILSLGTSPTRTGIVVDSHLGDLAKYNNHEIPIHDGFYLPEGYQLLYASSDCADKWPNKLMKYCDTIASRLLRERYGV